MTFRRDYEQEKSKTGSRTEMVVPFHEKINEMHEYFMNSSPTATNEYTGMFEGKNLIYITVEGWAPAAINEKLTPTLYMMKNEGFVFENYYNSLWGGSPATGEYANITGNFYKVQILHTFFIYWIHMFLPFFDCFTLIFRKSLMMAA